MGLFVSRDALARLPVSSSLSQVSARAEWETPATGRFKPVRKSKDAITVSDSVNRITARLIEKAGPVVADAFNRHLVPIAEQAFDAWPVQTGRSKAALALEIEVAADGQSLTGRIVNTAPYASGIRGGSVVEDLIFAPGIEAAHEMAIAIARGLSE